MRFQLAVSVPWGLVRYVIVDIARRNTDGRQVLPLTNIIFGRLAQNFNNYFVPDPTMKESSFKSVVNKYSSVPSGLSL